MSNSFKNAKQANGFQLFITWMSYGKSTICCFGTTPRLIANKEMKNW